MPIKSQGGVHFIIAPDGRRWQAGRRPQVNAVFDGQF